MRHPYRRNCSILRILCIFHPLNRWSDLPGHYLCTLRSGSGHSAYHGSIQTAIQFQPNDGEQHWFKDWNEERQHKLTASTFAAATGFWRGRRTQLWLEKIGAIRPFVGNAATQWSSVKELEALERYMLITGHSILLPSFQQCNASTPDEDWIGASADGIIEHSLYGLPYDGILEIKCPYFGENPPPHQPWSKVPVHYMPQAQGLMEIIDRNWMDLYCWTPNGSSLFRLHRNRPYWNLLKSALSDFWWNHVQPAREICSLYPVEDPIWQLSPFRPASKHHRFKDIVYASKLLTCDSRLLLMEGVQGKTFR